MWQVPANQPYCPALAGSCHPFFFNLMTQLA